MENGRLYIYFIVSPTLECRACNLWFSYKYNGQQKRELPLYRCVCFFFSNLLILIDISPVRCSLHSFSLENILTVSLGAKEEYLITAITRRNNRLINDSSGNRFFQLNSSVTLSLINSIRTLPLLSHHKAPSGSKITTLLLFSYTGLNLSGARIHLVIERDQRQCSKMRVPDGTIISLGGGGEGGAAQ